MGKKERNKQYHERMKKIVKADKRPQDVFPEFMDYRRKLNTSEYSFQANPHVESILDFDPPKWLFTPLKITSQPVAVMVETPEVFFKMMDDILSCSVIAVDMECHTDHSFLGMIMIIQFLNPYL